MPLSAAVGAKRWAMVDDRHRPSVSATDVLTIIRVNVRQSPCVKSPLWVLRIVRSAAAYRGRVRRAVFARLTSPPPETSPYSRLARAPSSATRTVSVKPVGRADGQHIVAAFAVTACPQWRPSTSMTPLLATVASGLRQRIDEVTPPSVGRADIADAD